MPCTIRWNQLNFSEWEQRFKSIPRPNLLQSYAYAQAICPLKGLKPRWGMIYINEQEAGLVQIFEAGILKNAIHAVILDRGPLWFDGYETEQNIQSFFKEFNDLFPNRWGRKRRIIPETTLDISPYGYTKTGPGYQTRILDLRQNNEKLRKNLKKNWRGTLKKAEKQGVRTEWDEKGEHLAWLLQHYAVDKETKGYDGPSVKLIKALAKTMIPRGDMIIGRAILDDKPIAGIMILRHGAGATYQLGFSSNAGRSVGAHHILLWNAMLELKDKGIKDFDLGGINNETAKGVQHFKEGMGGTVFNCSGLYR